MPEEKPLFAPSPQAVAASQMQAFLRRCNEIHDLSLVDFTDLHAWSVAEPGLFWSLVWDFCRVIGEKDGPALVEPDRMLDARFFPQAKLNFAENLLRGSGEGPALIFRGEDRIRDDWSHERLRATVSRLQQAFRALGIGHGDRIAAMMPNMPETIACMLAAASIGAVWSSCSPDFGEQGAFDRFGQIEPRLLIACDAYLYAGKRQDVRQKARALAERLSVPLWLVPYAGEERREGEGPETMIEAALAPYEPQPIQFERLPFSHPLYILFSSGTTGIPKCIVHSAGGTLLQHLKEHRLHCNIGPGDRVFYFTTCGWMMWNWLASALAAEAVLCLYDGSPFHPDGNCLMDYAAEERMTFFGTSAKYIDALRKSGIRPVQSHDLSHMRMMASTGSPLSPEGFDFVYRDVKPDIHLASISGGTDIVSCFVLGNPLQPVWRGEIQGPGLGLAVDVWDEDGHSVTGEKGELVCTRAFPSMPIGFWNDPDRAKYRAAYFDRFDNVWCHGDFAERTVHGGLIIHGRSDATLNPGGVRIGTAEIYNQVERMEEILEALCIGQDWEGDQRIVLFLRLAEGAALTETLEQEIRRRIRSGASPRHVPAKILAVSDIPRTKSGKIVELAVREMVHGRPVKNREALANPEALALFADLEALKT